MAGVPVAAGAAEGTLFRPRRPPLLLDSLASSLLLFELFSELLILTSFSTLLLFELFELFELFSLLALSFSSFSCCFLASFSAFVSFWIVRAPAGFGKLIAPETRSARSANARR
jgi:hypothetical protein